MHCAPFIKNRKNKRESLSLYNVENKTSIYLYSLLLNISDSVMCTSNLEIAS